MKQPTSPCLGCPDRCPEPNCHITCERYLAYSKECEVLRKERLKVAEQHYDIRAIEKRRIKMASEGRFYTSKYYSRKKGE